MGNFVLAYTGGSMPESPEEGEKVMAAWMGWFGALGAAVVDRGNPFGPSMSISPDGKATDGNAAGLTGYSIISADTLAEATEMAKRCPQLASGGSVEVYETIVIGEP